jgi:16S rRNA (guanine527-N7)-methyltransferase
MTDALDDLAALQDGIAALGLSLPAGAAEKLIAYRDLLLKWNKTYNLTALKDPADAIAYHLLDSLAILTAWDQAAALPPGICHSSVMDVGSGGGLPGLVLAIARPDLSVTLVDAVQKKTAFLRQTTIELALKNVTVHHARVEHLQGRYAVITSRAFAELKDFVALTRHLLAPGGRWLAMKGQRPTAELAALPAWVQARNIWKLKAPGLNADRHLILLEENTNA